MLGMLGMSCTSAATGTERMTKITLVRVPELSGLDGNGVSRRD